MNIDFLHTPCDCNEQFGLLKFKVMDMVRGKTIDPVVISFTSYREGEGVSTTITNFAHELSNDRRCKVLLVDFNVINPSLHKFFPMPAEKQPDGNGQADAKGSHGRHNQKIEASDHLHVITTNKRNSRHLPQQNRFEIIRFFLRAKQEYDYILLDCPPIEHNNFATMLACKADYTVLVVEAHRVRSQILCEMVNQLEQLGANILGVILNKRQHPIPRFIYNML